VRWEKLRQIIFNTSGVSLSQQVFLNKELLPVMRGKEKERERERN
jgi:hypothetical protein